VTSPPYWGLRSYLPADHPDKEREIGSEPTLGEFLQTMVGVFDLCRQVLADDGTMWVNMGDSYAGGGNGAANYPASSSTKQLSNHGSTMAGRNGYVPPGLKPKDLVGQPWRLAFALQDAGWYLRQDIIWHKPNPMPESIKDRCTKAHEYIFLLSKSERYYFDQGAIRTPLGGETKALSFETMDFKARDKYKMPDGWATHDGGHGSFHRDGREAGAPPHGSVAARKARAAEHHKSAPTDERNGIRPTSKRNSFARETKNTAGEHGQKPQHRPDRDEVHYAETANKRSVWTVATEAYPGSHYATFPRALIEPCILAGAPAGGIVLDIFMGSGTTAQVAEQLGRKWIGIDLDDRNGALQLERLRQPSLDLEAEAV
jgi:DNA modification methylase